MGKTIVFQSFRTTNVPGWIEPCLESVRIWSANKDYDYLFFDDRFFECLPTWYRGKVNDDKCLLSDLARLITARRLLDSGYERVIWVDADIIIFDQANFNISVASGFAFCKEVWIGRRRRGKIPISYNVNNAVAVFAQDAKEFLDFYIEACYAIIRDKQGTPYKTDVGTAFLTGLSPIMKFQLIDNVGLFSPQVMEAIATENRYIISKYMSAFGYRMAAANLCGSFRGEIVDRVQMTDELYQKVIDKLVYSSGKLLEAQPGWAGWLLGVSIK